MDPVKEVIALLEADAGVGALVGDRIYPIIAPEKATIPQIRLLRVSSREEYDVDGPTNWRKDQLEVQCLAKNYGEARSIDQAVRDKLAGFEGAGTSCYIMAILLGDIEDNYFPTSKSYVCSLFIDVYYRGL